MLEVSYPEDCGNSPRKLLLRDFNIAFAKGDTQAVLDLLSDNITWDIVGDRVIEGKAAFQEALAGMAGSEAAGLRIDSIITHGTTAAANGLITLRDGKQDAFCDVYLFAGAGRNAKMTRITSYAISL
jgi:hypothetical protein